ncbi:MAG: DUF4221 domain-containing protein [Tannerella sp.]|jgi:hypothetical protein|nr:DUF4221 domain-containing protein [Tannerella sp.]
MIHLLKFGYTIKNIKFHPLLIACCICLSCSNSKSKQSGSNKYELKEVVGKDLSFRINDDTKFIFSSLFPYTDKSGKEYLTFLSHMKNLILFYDLQTGKYIFDVKLETEGPDGVGIAQGYHIEDLDNIYIASTLPGLTKVDTSGNKKQFIEYGQTNNGHYVVPNFTSSSYIYAPAIIHAGKIYITQLPYSGSKTSAIPVSVAIDTISQTFEELPFRFPPIIDDKELAGTVISIQFSREFNDKQLIYSFFMDNNIYVTDIETNEAKKIPAQSKYINDFQFLKFTDDREKVYKALLESSYYYNILYDKYRNIYYRFAIIGSEVTKKPEYSFFDIYANGFIQFSVIILDKDFNIIGETLFPKYTYNPSIAFVHKDGLYISDSHILNPTFDENKLSFKCFALKECL